MWKEKPNNGPPLGLIKSRVAISGPWSCLSLVAPRAERAPSWLRHLRLPVLRRQTGREDRDAAGPGWPRRSRPQLQAGAVSGLQGGALGS